MNEGEEVKQVRAMARRIVESGSFRGTDGTGPSEGERWLHACAYGDGVPGSGNAPKWLEAGHSQHLTFVVDQLARPG